MSHSKYRKKGSSLYLDSWNPSAKRFIVACAHCGSKGFKQSILEPDFDKNLERKAIKKELMALFTLLEINSFGFCNNCAELIEKDNSKKNS